jgi:hypothetical protein
MEIVYVAPENIGAAWQHFRDYAEQVIEMTGGRRTSTGFLMDLINGNEILWMIMEEDEAIGFCSMAFIHYDKAKILQVKMLSGDKFDEWKDPLNARLEVFAQENGCNGMELIGRRGWVRRLADLGWQERFTTMEKRFDE